MRIIFAILCFISFAVQAKEINTLTDVISLLGKNDELTISIPVHSKNGRNIYLSNDGMYYYDNSNKLDSESHSFKLIEKDGSNYIAILKTERNSNTLNDIKKFTIQTRIGNVEISYFGGEVLRASVYNDVGYGNREEKDIETLKAQISERLLELGFERSKDKGGISSFINPESRNLFKKDNVYISVSKLYRSDVLVTSIFVENYNAKVEKANEQVRKRLDKINSDKIIEFYK